MQRAGLALVLLCTMAGSAKAQAPRSIDPGMSQAQVVERFGEPDLSRKSGDFTYLFYRNSCGRACGVDDVVILQKDSVVDVVLRAADRTYSGKSSSPRAIPADVAARTRPGARDVAAEAKATAAPAHDVVQAGSPKPDATPAAPKKSDSAAAKPPAEKSHTSTTPPAAAPRPDTAQRDSIMRGSLRIKVMPKNFTPPSRDSLRADSSGKRPPHQE